MKIAIAGTGYVGLVTAVCLADYGHDVTCVDVDVDEEKISFLNRTHKSPIYEKGLDFLMEKNASHLTYTTDYKSAYREADVIFIGVGTPEKRDGSANLSYVFRVARQIAESIERECVVVVKSTVPIGTNEKVEQFLHEHCAPGVCVHIASNPEFLSQGTAVNDTLFASRIVLGVEDAFSKETLLALYHDFPGEKVVTNRRSAEMIKYASNDFLAVKISYINEIANLCEDIGANIDDVAHGMGLDQRIGNKFLHAGIGYGGSCFPKDTKALHWLSAYHELELKTVKAAIEVNDHQKFKLLRKASKYYSDLKGKKVAILGLTFKPGTDDLREAPSLANVPILLEDGAEIRAYDPVGIKNFQKYYPDEIVYTEDIDTAIDGADICLIFTEWPEIKAYPLARYREKMRQPIVLDGRNCYALEQVRQAGIIYESIGRASIVPEMREAKR